MTLKKKALENTVGKGENTGKPAFSPFPTVLSTLSKRAMVMLTAFNLPSANAFNLIMSKILSFGKGSKKYQYISQCGSKIRMYVMCSQTLIYIDPKPLKGTQR